MATVPDTSGNGTTTPDTHYATRNELLKKIADNTEPA